MNARSEFVLLKRSDGREVESSRMFHEAWPASYSPALRPMRGSGDGAPGDRLSLVTIGLGDDDADAGECAQAALAAIVPAIISSARFVNRNREREDMVISGWKG